MPSLRASRLFSLGPLLALAGCATPGPPLPPGLVDMRTAAPGQTTLAAQGGIGGYLDSNGGPIYGGGALSVEPRAGERLSVPIGVGSGGSVEGEGVALSTRVGLRYRFMEAIAFGGGVDSSHFLSSSSAGEIDGVGFDLELGGGGAFGRFSTSGTFRPTFLFSPHADAGYVFFAVFDLSAGYAVVERLTLAAHLWGGTWSQGYYGSRGLGTIGYMAGTIGLSYTFGELR